MSDENMGFEEEKKKNKDLNIISNYLKMGLVLVGVAGGFFLLGIIEAGIQKQYNTHLPLGFVILFIWLVLTWVASSFMIVKSATTFWTGLKEIRYTIKRRYVYWRWDPVIQHREVSWLHILDYRILEYIEKYNEKGICEISTYLLYDEDRVRERLDVLKSKDMIEKSEDRYSIGINGRKFLYGYLSRLDLQAIGK
ncbi:hypothetical protein ACFQL7_13940 [Halocatena marina]|uniref:Uncharacterized protein n=1 Tax=Halocatena marina TaxID=2934937 RepID=A0ABD5YRQ9_9EURY